MVKVFAQGSCRIHRPLSYLAKRNHIDLLNGVDPKWFTHTAAAARQSLEIVMGVLDPPLHLRELVFETNNERQIQFHAPELIKSADLVLVEVCTLTSVLVDGWETNAHRMHRATKAQDDRIGSAERFVRSAEDLADDLDKIRRMTGKKILVINHIAKTGSPEMDRARRKASQAIEEAREQIGFAFFDTASILENVELSDALDSPHHYKKSFEPVVAAAFLDSIAEAIHSDQKQGGERMG